MLDTMLKKHPMHMTIRDAGVTQAQAAKFCGTSLSTLTQALNGYRATPGWLEARLALLKDEIERKTKTACNAE